jgi:hypothetical protein
VRLSANVARPVYIVAFANRRPRPDCVDRGRARRDAACHAQPPRSRCPGGGRPGSWGLGKIDRTLFAVNRIDVADRRPGRRQDPLKVVAVLTWSTRSATLIGIPRLGLKVGADAE